MSNTNTTISTANTTFLNKTYYVRLMLETAKTAFVHAKYGMQEKLPKHGGKHIEFRRPGTLDPEAIADGLVEGVTPDGLELQYGAYIEVSDMLKNTAFDDVMKMSSEELGEAVGTAVEWVTRDAMNSGTNVQYANGKTARDALTAADKLTTVEIRKAVRTLKKNKAKRFTGEGRNGHFICICSPEATYDLQDDEMWRDVSKYSNAEQVYSGEIGRLFDVVFVESTEAKVFAGGSGGVDVHSALIFGRNAYGVVKMEGGGNLKMFIEGLGSAGTADPLHQRATVGAKVDGYATTILNDAWMVRVEHGATA